MSSNNDENRLILDILKNIEDKIETLRKDFQQIHCEQARQNVIVAEHQRRSTASEKRIAIMEKDAQFFKHFIMIMTGLGGVILFVLKLVSFFHNHL